MGMTDKTEETCIDKSSWPDGPWKNEPDHVSWVDPETGYRCFIKRPNGSLGHLCGYVAVEKGHPFYEQEYEDNDYEICEKLECHGGVTFTGFGTDKIWKIGFDCAHLYDIAPGRLKYFDTIEDNATYKGISYVTKEVESLAKQLKELEENEKRNENEDE